MQLTMLSHITNKKKLRVFRQHPVGGDVENRRAVIAPQRGDCQRGKGALAGEIRLDPADLGQRAGA